MKRLEALLELGGLKRDIVFLVLSGISLIFSFFRILLLPFDIAWVAIVLCGIPIILEAVIGLVTEFDIKADVLVSIALIASVIIGEDFAAGEVAFIMQLGALLEDLTVKKARAGMENLVKLTPRTARVLRNGAEQIVPADQVAVGDILRVLPGESIPVDGVIVQGQTSIDQSIMTGESIPVDKSAGDEVKSGTVNQFGAFEMRAVQVGENSSLQRMIRLVQSADASKAKIVGLADRWATWIVVIALVAAALTWAISGEVIRAVTILVVFCPCALVLATPTAIMAAIGNVTKHGILVREGDALERLSQVRRITFDKTGTLTYGKPEVVQVTSYIPQVTDQRLYSWVAAAESLSEHPLGKAITAGYRKKYGEKLPIPTDFQMNPGRGVSAVIEGKKILAGNLDWLEGYSMSKEQQEEITAYRDKGCTIVHIVADGKTAGFAALSDQMRENAQTTIAKIKEQGIVPVLLTGDHKQAAERIASQAGITEVQAECLPEDKLSAIDSFQQAKQFVCMVGDGINDAPALKKAHVGIAMGGIGSDIAVDAADMALVRDDISAIPHLLSLSKRMMTTIKINLSFSMALNFLSIILSILGILNPVVGALVHNSGSVLVIVHSAFLLGWKKKEKHGEKSEIV